MNKEYDHKNWCEIIDTEKRRVLLVKIDQEDGKAIKLFYTDDNLLARHCFLEAKDDATCKEIIDQLRETPEDIEEIIESTIESENDDISELA